MTIALIVACLTLGGAALWRASRLPAEAATASAKDKQRLQERLQKGVGSEVRFASAAARPEQIAEAVRSTNDFIYWRSGLRMSEETKMKLAEAESNVLKGKAQYISLGELTDNITATVAERLATLTDEEIQQASEVSSDEHREVWSRADGNTTKANTLFS